MEVEFSLKHEEFFESCKIIQEQQKKPKLQWKLLSWVFIVLVFCIGFNYYYTGGTKQGLMFLIVGCGIGWLSFSIVYVQYFKQIQSDYFPDNEGVVLGSRTLIISPAGIEQKNKHFSSMYNWTTVKSVIETPSVFIVLFDKALFQAVPKSILDEQRQIQFSRIVTEHHGEINKFNMPTESNTNKKPNGNDGW
ncbi:YcxB family protein [Colwellia psychrerythraea]|uniref:YcxB-like protein n=1 Tax=Colwellia psychrerythraea TaxID=28229 RepID=A0A099L009_COLPS|nr:YcxB family protein [Colwellia psychrerythraea]KGJ95198.1 YcxB-like protein [Colwellia psychrerythraea]